MKRNGASRPFTYLVEPSERRAQTRFIGPSKGSEPSATPVTSRRSRGAGDVKRCRSGIVDVYRSTVVGHRFDALLHRQYLIVQAITTTARNSKPTERPVSKSQSCLLTEPWMMGSGALLRRHK